MNKLFIGDICSIIQQDDSLLTPSDWGALERFGSERRRTEQFAWRLLLRSSLLKLGCDDDVATADIDYDEVGAPYLVGCNTHIYIGVSHSISHAAVVVADHPCAVDIELCSRNFAKVQSRFLSQSEVELLSSYDQEGFALPLAWSTKEALYKLSNTNGLDFVDDITLLAIDSEACTITGRISRGRFGNQPIALNYHFSDNHIVVWHL